MASVSRKRESDETNYQRAVNKQKLESSDFSLNYDVLIHIFRRVDLTTLSSAALVCKDWRTAAYYPLFWKSKVCALGTNVLTYETAKSLVQRNIRIVQANCEDDDLSFSGTLVNCAEVVRCQTLHLSNLPTNSSVCHNFPQKFDSLRHLALLDPVHELNIDGLKRLLSPLVNLRQLYIEWSDDSYDTFDEDYYDAIEAIFTSLPNLKDLELVNDHFFLYRSSPKSLVFPLLERLVVDLGASEAFEEGANRFLSLPDYFPGLKHLAIPTHNFIKWDLDTEATKASFQSLESLSFGSGCATLLPDPFTAIFRNSHNLKALDLYVSTPCYRDVLEDEDFEAIVNSLPNLSVLIYGHQVSLKTVNKTMSKMKNMEMLASVGDGSPDHQDIMEFIDSVQAHMPKLFSLLDIFGVDLTCHLDMLSNIRYVSATNARNWLHKIVKRLEGNTHQTVQLMKVKEGSADWHEAVCTRWFTIPDTYDFGL